MLDGRKQCKLHFLFSHQTTLFNCEAHTESRAPSWLALQPFSIQIHKIHSQLRRIVCLEQFALCVKPLVVNFFYQNQTCTQNTIDNNKSKRLTNLKQVKQDILKGSVLSFVLMLLVHTPYTMNNMIKRQLLEHSVTQGLKLHEQRQRFSNVNNLHRNKIKYNIKSNDNTTFFHEIIECNLKTTPLLSRNEIKSNATSNQTTTLHSFTKQN